MLDGECGFSRWGRRWADDGAADSRNGGMLEFQRGSTEGIPLIIA